MLLVGRIVLALVICVSPIAAFAEDHSLRTFDKLPLSKEYFAEGASVGDFNKDGKVDVVCGPYWYEGPSFKVRRPIYEGAAFPNDRGYSNNFFSFVSDFDRDGWDDVLVIGLPGTAAHWYKNSRGKGLWSKHLAMPKVDNEAPTFFDIDGDDRPELLCTFEGRLGFAKPQASQPTARWNWTPLSEKGPWQRFSHGLGAGDVNRDGRADFLMPQGWWEQPAKNSNQPWKKHAGQFSRGGAQIYAVDVNQDGLQDIVSSNSAHAWGLDWYQATKAGTFKRRPVMGAKPAENPYGVAFSQLHALVCADVDDDGRVDIVTGKCYWAHNGHDPGARDPAVLYWFRNTKTASGGVEFVPHLIDNDSGLGRQIHVGDVNGDGLTDVVSANKKGVFVFVQRTKRVSAQEWREAQPKRRQVSNKSNE